MKTLALKNRVITAAVALFVVAALVALALVAGGDSDGPARLPVLGSGGGGAPTAAMADESAGSMRYGGSVEYRVRGDLPELDGEEHAWTLEPAEADLDRFAALARILGVDGEMMRTEYGWTVSDEDDRLDIQRVAGLPWSRYEAVVEDVVAEESEVRGIQSGGGSSGSSGSSVSSSGSVSPEPSGEPTPTTSVQPCPAPCPPDAQCEAPRTEDHAVACGGTEPYEEPKRPENLPSKDEAERIGRELLDELGVDLDHAAVRVEDGFSVWIVSADPEVGGLPVVGMTTSLGIGPEGKLVFGNGWLGEASRGERYPLIGTTAAIDRLREQQVAIMGAPEPMIARAPDCDPAADCVPPEPTVVTITGVRLGLQLFSYFEVDGPAYLVPSYLFTTDDGGEMPVIAVPDRYLAQAPHEEPHEPGTGVEPGEPTAPPNGGQSCTGQDATDGVFVQVCGPDVVEAGEIAVFSFTAKGRVRDDCGSPVPSWGDGSEVAVCAIGCESLPAEPRGVERTFEHVYEKPGTYTATFTLAGCGADNEGAGSISMEVRVEG